MNYYKQMEEATRPDGTTFVKCKDNAPKELDDFIEALHRESFDYALCNDWVYQIVLEALEELESNGNDLEDCVIEADIYTYDLKRWFLEPYAEIYCLEAAGICEFSSSDIIKLISYAQYLAKEVIYTSVCSFLENNQPEYNEEEHDDE